MSSAAREKVRLRSSHSHSSHLSPDPCCPTIRVTSTGEAALDQPLYIGVYRRHSQTYNDRAVYVKEGEREGEELFAYFFISEQHGVSLWVVGPKLGEFRAGIRNSEAGDCIHGLSRSWKFASRTGVWADTDPTLTVQCEEADTEVQDGNKRERNLFESKKLRPKALSVPCSWTEWGGWSSCSKSCGGGRQVRVRRARGSSCQGGNRERRVCNTASCPRRTTRRRITTTTTLTTSTTTTRTTTRTTTTRRTTRPPTTRPPRPPSVPVGGRVQCFTCGSLYSTSAPDCPLFEPEDPGQRQTCGEGEACLYYSWQKAPEDRAVIRECFPTSVLLGSLDRPVVPRSDCRLEPVEEEDNIEACICTSDYCNLGTRPSQG